LRSELKKILASLLTVALVVGLLPGYAMAATGSNDADVITSIGYTNTDTVKLSTSGQRSITLTATYAYVSAGTSSDTSDDIKTFDLSSGINAEYNSAYDNFVISFSNSGVATIGGSAITMTVDYTLASDTSTTYETVYSVSVVAASYVKPTFTGTITKTAKLVNSSAEITFSEDDFTAKYTENDGGSLGYIAVTKGTNPDFGTLEYKGTELDPDSATLISMSNIESGYLTFQATGTGTVAYTVVAYASDDKSTAIGSVTVTIKIQAVSTPTISSTVSKSISSGSSTSFSLSDFSNCYSLDSGTLSAITVTPTTATYGTWYNGSTKMTTGTAVAFTASTISNLKYVAGTTAGSDTFSWTVSTTEGGTSSSKTGNKITVSVTISSVTYSTDEGETALFNNSDFYSVCNSAGYGTLDYIVISALPSSSKGTLYYGYSSDSSKGSKVTTSTKLYYSTSKSINLDEVAFVPYSGYTGTVTISYTGYNSSGTSYSGSITMTVSEGDGDVDTVTYKTDEDTTVEFDNSDFNDVCTDADYETLSYICITTLPSSSKGVLYYGYSSDSSKGSKVTTSTKLYYSTSKSINLDEVAFIPYSSYTGSFTIPYKGYDTDGDSFTGYIKITVSDSDSDGDVDTVTYTTDEDTTAEFDNSDFNEVCTDADYETLSYICITTLPSSSKGVLYYGYSSDSSKGSKVTTSTKLYYSTSKSINLDEVAFIPYSGYTGTLTIPYKGYDTDGDSFTGSIKITVSGSSSSETVDTITYTTDEDTTVEFDNTDFNDVCTDADYETLSYICITTLPSSSKGVLYDGYSSDSDKGSKVTTSTKLYYSTSKSINLDEVAFIPASGYTGTLTIPYKGYDTDGESFTGSIKITVSGSSNSSTVDAVSYTTDGDTAVEFDNSDFNAVCTDADYETLNYIYIKTLPSSAKGMLYYDYSSSSDPGTKVTTSTELYYSTAKTSSLNKVAFVPASDFTGTLTIAYTGYDVSGDTFSGTITITVNEAEESSLSQYFSDITSNYTWASTQIDSLYEAGVVTGLGNNQFGPSDYLKRGDFILMLYRALGFSSSSTSNFEDVSSDDYYSEALAAAKALGIAEGSDGYFYPTNNITRQDVMVLVYRALQVADKGLSPGSSSDLADFSDQSNVSSYAVTAVAALVNEGIVTGSDGILHPRYYITRAEMAVILYRVLNR